MLTHTYTHVLTLNRSIPLNGNTSSIARSPSDVGIYKNALSESVLTHTHVLTLNRSIPLNGNTSSIARSPSDVGIYKNAIHTLSECVLTHTHVIDLKQINSSQWEHIKHRQLIPIEKVGIYENAFIHYQASPVDPHRRGGHLYKNATHTSSEGVC